MQMTTGNGEVHGTREKWKNKNKNSCETGRMQLKEVSVKLDRLFTKMSCAGYRKSEKSGRILIIFKGRVIPLFPMMV